MATLLIMRKASHCKINWHNCRSSSVLAPEENQLYSEVPVYPALFDPSVSGRWRLTNHKWHDRIRAMPTVEEKLYEISKGIFGKDKVIRAVVTKGMSERYGTLPLELYCTRTHLISGLPECYNSEDIEKSASVIATQVKPSILEAIRHVYGDVNKAYNSFNNGTEKIMTPAKLDKIKGQQMIDHILRAVTLSAVNDYEHLHQCQVDYNPRCDAFWLKGDFPPDLMMQDIRKNIRKKYPHAELPDAPVDIWFQYLGRPYLQMRSDVPMQEFLPRDADLCTTIQVPPFPYDPRSVGYSYSTRRATSVPGFWPTDPFNCALVSFHTRELAVYYRCRFDADTLQDALHGFGVMASFGWLTALATHHGFTPFNEITYPFTTQTVITNGQFWSFYAFQLNTIALGLHVDTKTHQNICWTTNEEKLFDAVEGNEVKGFNEKVLTTVIKFILRKPVQRDPAVILRPYLGEAKHTDEEWKNIDCELKSRYENRPRSTSERETPLWEIIYKKKFNAKIE